MAPRRKVASLARMLAAVALAVVAVLVAVSLIVPAPRREGAPTTPRSAALRPAPASGLPSYVVRIPPPLPERPEAPLPPAVTLSVQPVAAAAPEARTEKWYVTARALNVRAGPNSQSQPVGALPRGTAVELSGREGNWVQVTAGDVTGWAFVKYLSQTPP